MQHITSRRVPGDGFIPRPPGLGSLDQSALHLWIIQGLVPWTFQSTFFSFEHMAHDWTILDSAALRSSVVEPVVEHSNRKCLTPAVSYARPSHQHCGGRLEPAICLNSM